MGFVGFEKQQVIVNTVIQMSNAPSKNSIVCDQSSMPLTKLNLFSVVFF